MGSKTWISLSVLSLGLAALVGCNNPEKVKTGSYKDVARPVAGQPASTAQFPTVPGQPNQIQQPYQFSPNGQNNLVPANGTRTGAPYPSGGVPPLNQTGGIQYPQPQPGVPPLPTFPANGNPGAGGIPQYPNPGTPSIGGYPAPR